MSIPLHFVGGGAAAAAAARVNAIKASGAIVQLEPEEFLKIVGAAEKPLIVVATSGWFTKKFDYLTPYRGLVFFTRSKTFLAELPADAELIAAQSIWVPDR